METTAQNAAKKAWETRRRNLESTNEFSKRVLESYEKNLVVSSEKHKFENVAGIEKIKRREQKAVAYKNSGLTGGYLLFMPSQTCADIEQINKTIPGNTFKFIGSEINPDTCIEISAKIKEHKYNMNLIPFSIGDIVKHTGANEFSHADFDFCETFSRYYNVIAQSVKKDIVQKNGVISMTFAARDKNITKVAPKFLGKKRFDAIQKAKAISNKDPEARLVIPTVTIFLNKLCKSGRYKIVCAPETYTDSKVGNHMVFAMIQRIK